MTKAVENMIESTKEKVVDSPGTAPLIGRNPSEPSPGAINAVAVDTVVRL